MKVINSSSFLFKCACEKCTNFTEALKTLNQIGEATKIKKFQTATYNRILDTVCCHQKPFMCLEKLNGLKCFAHSKVNSECTGL